MHVSITIDRNELGVMLASTSVVRFYESAGQRVKKIEKNRIGRNRAESTNPDVSLEAHGASSACQQLSLEPA